VWQSEELLLLRVSLWSEQLSRFAPEQSHLKLSAQILSLLFADKPLVIRIPKDS
jgi:hypothetical protein